MRSPNLMPSKRDAMSLGLTRCSLCMWWWRWQRPVQFFSFSFSVSPCARNIFFDAWARVCKRIMSIFSVWMIFSLCSAIYFRKRTLNKKVWYTLCAPLIVWVCLLGKTRTQNMFTATTTTTTTMLLVLIFEIEIKILHTTRECEWANKPANERASEWVNELGCVFGRNGWSKRRRGRKRRRRREKETNRCLKVSRTNNSSHMHIADSSLAAMMMYMKC